MSDVWQGPGWWLASDGKWYPADAEPGAVYEGDLPHKDSPAVEAAQPVAFDPPSPVASATATAPPPEPALAPTPEVPAPAAPASRAEMPQVAVPAEQAPPPQEPTSSVATEPTPVVAEPATPTFSAAPFMQMPAPVVEQPSPGGWQTIEPVAAAPATPAAPEQPASTPPPAPAQPAPAQPGEVDEDGWTSAYEERQEAHAPEMVIPEATAPIEDVPSTAVPGQPTPMAPSAVIVPPVETPEVEVPTAQIPDAAPPLTDESQAMPDDTSAPIERDDAWRKPSTPDETVDRSTVPPVPGVPNVVDLAIPEEPFTYPPETRGRNWTLVGGVLVAIAALVGIAFLIASLLSGGDDDVDTSDPGTTPAVTEPGTDTTATPSTEASAPSTEDEGDPNSVSVFDLRAGDCIVGDIGAGQVTKVTKVDCQEEHQFEVYREALIDSSITSFNEEAISAYAEEVCRTSLEAYVPADDDRGLKFKFLQPTEDSWNQEEDPDRVITCLLFDDDAPLVGRAA